MTETDYGSAVALIGMSGRFPGADSVAQLWRNLLAGVKGLRELTDEELRAAGADPGQLADPRYVRTGGPLSPVDTFDAGVFGVNPREAQTMDPQHRLFLECTWEALEAAGYCPTDIPGHTGVFAGCGFPDYLVQNLTHLMTEPGGLLLLSTGNERDSLASLVSYKLGLRGPSIGVQTFCSTSLVAVHLACQSLLTYESDIALAGGAFVPLPQPAGYLYEPGSILSPDGVVRSFDAQANGSVMTSGVGVVALKRMADALADGDVVHAVILGSASNNDGRVRAGYTAPGVDGQAEVIELALGVAAVKPDTIGYVECHATGTVLGDSIELAAMNRAFAQPRDTPCVLGTLKPSVGHLDRAAGVAGLIRAALTLEHELLPATPNYASPNPAMAPVPERFTVLTEHRPWPAGPHPRRAGVSSFGVGGTNAHVVLEQAPARPARPHRAGPHLLTFSALNAAALQEVTDRLREHLSTPDGPAAAGGGEDLADVAYTLQVSRCGFAMRRAVVCADRADAVTALADPSRWIDGKTQRRDPAVRLVAPPAGVPEQWWAELHAALALAEGRGAGGTGTADRRAAALDALAGHLTRLGVRVVRETHPATGVTEVAVQPPATGSAAEWLLATLARLWQAGSTVDWPALHRGQGRRVELPTYPFQRHRYWIDPRPTEAAVSTDVWWKAPGPPGRTFDRTQWTYLPTWQRRPQPLAGLDERLRAAGPWLVLTADERGEALVAHLRRAGAEVTAVRPGERFHRDPAGDCTVGQDATEDLALLLGALRVEPRAVVHGFSLAGREPEPGGDPMAHFDAEQSGGFHSALALARALVDDTGSAPRMDVVLLTSGAVDVVGSDLRHPEHATLAALGPSLAQENPRLRCRHLDVDPVPAGSPRALAEATAQLLSAAVNPHEGPAAVRGGEVWLRRYEPFPIAEPADGQGPIGPGDTVLITGGLGDVGLMLSRHLAGRYGCRLVLTARTALPPREQWADLLAGAADGGRTARHIRNVLDLEARGATVLAMSADVADEAQMRAVVDAAVARFGGIDVVVHAAGAQDRRLFDFAHLLDREACALHFAAKVRGLHVLQAVLGEHARDRRITISSLSAVLGGISLGPYAAANAGLDAYARSARTAGAGRWVTVDWDTWGTDPAPAAGNDGGAAGFAMAPAEAVDVFERALSAADRVGHLVISTGSLGARFAQWVTGDIHDAGADDGRERHPRPELNTPFVAPREGTEAKLAEIWSRVLAIESIGALDNFSELGGHSLLAIDLTARIRTSLGISIPVIGLLERPTVRQLADLVDSHEAPDRAAPDGSTVEGAGRHGDA
jgi:acyl transferase domain-containing protein/acyl carrier protein